MDEQEIRTRPDITLKPNVYFSQVDKPFLYQKRMILMMLQRAQMVNGDDVGLGKTLESIVAYTYLKAANPQTKALVFTEKIVLEKWRDEILALTHGIKAKIITAETHPDVQYRISAFRHFQADVLITTYSTAYDYGSYLLEAMAPRFVLMADEPNYFKSTDSKLYERMAIIANAAARRYGLTATLCENRLEEVFSIMSIITPGVIPGKIYFEENFCKKVLFKKPRYHYRVVGYKNLGLFRDIIQPGYFGRLQTDPEVNQALPEVINSEFKIVLGKEQSKKLMDAMDLLLSLPDGGTEQLTVLTSIVRAQQLANDPGLLGFDIASPKTDALVEALKGQLLGQSVLIHSRMRTQIDRLEKEFRKQGIEHVRITGAEKTDKRIENAKRFNNGDVPVVLMTRAGLKGADLQQGAHFIWYDLPWSWGHYKQGVGRIKRTGSLHRRVVAHRMRAVLHPEVAKDYDGDDSTIDDYTLEVLLKKRVLANAVQGDSDNLEITEADLTATCKEILAVYKARRESRK